MAKFSTTQGVNVAQAELDFVDVDTATDNQLYLDPYAIQIRDDEWSAECGDHIHSFFNEVLDALRAGNDARAIHLLSNLHEPNETFLVNHRAYRVAAELASTKPTILLPRLEEAEHSVPASSPTFPRLNYSSLTLGRIRFPI